MSNISISSASAIQERFLTFCHTIAFNPFPPDSNWDQIAQKLFDFLQSEYNLIPEKERIGKGAVFITKACSSVLIEYLFDSLQIDLNSKDYGLRWAAWCAHLFQYSQESYFLPDMAVTAAAEWIRQTKDPIRTFELIQPQILSWVTDDDWIIREISCEPLRSIGGKPSEQLFTMLRTWVQSKDENIRRWVSESFRPLNNLKWLRDPSKNKAWLVILSILRADPSEYVRKSVGNNLKDLSKYMPEKVLDLEESWIKDAKIQVTEDLSSISKKELGEFAFYLIWTLKQACRWMQERNPEYHERIRKMLGSNYVEFFNEKKNRMAKRSKPNRTSS